MHTIQTKIVPVKLTPTELASLDELRRLTHCESRSDTIRHALAALAGAKKLKRSARQQIDAERNTVGTRFHRRPEPTT